MPPSDPSGGGGECRIGSSEAEDAVLFGTGEVRSIASILSSLASEQGGAAPYLMLACNREENDLHWESADDEWVGRASMSARQSAGMMVNYRYRLKDIEKNHEAYTGDGKVSAAGAVRKLIKR